MKIVDGRKTESVTEKNDKEGVQNNKKLYNCEVCDFNTTHHPGLKSHTTKMHGENLKYSCEQCEETFDTRKKLKNHIYCIHSGKYKTLAQLIDEAVP